MKDRLELYVSGRPFDGGTYHYVESGLDNVFLLNGFTVEEDPDYGRLVSFHKVDDLHRAIGLHLVQLDRGLKPAEFRYLRKQMRLTQSKLAVSFGVDPQTIANYEKGVTTVPKPTDGYLRLKFILGIMPPDMRAECLNELTKCDVAPNASIKAQSARKQVVAFWEEKSCPLDVIVAARHCPGMAQA